VKGMGTCFARFPLERKAFSAGPQLGRRQRLTLCRGESFLPNGRNPHGLGAASLGQYLRKDAPPCPRVGGQGVEKKKAVRLKSAAPGSSKKPKKEVEYA